MNKSRYLGNLNTKFSGLQYIRKSMENKVIQDQGYVPKLFLNRVTAQHDLRKVHTIYAFSPSSKYIIQNLYVLCTHKYTMIRDKAQSSLWSIFNDFTNSYQVVIPNILDTLKLDPIENHEAQKVSFTFFIIKK